MAEVYSSVNGNAIMQSDGSILITTPFVQTPGFDPGILIYFPGRPPHDALFIVNNQTNLSVNDIVANYAIYKQYREVGGAYQSYVNVGGGVGSFLSIENIGGKLVLRAHEATNMEDQRELISAVNVILVKKLELPTPPTAPVEYGFSLPQMAILLIIAGSMIGYSLLKRR